MSSKKEAIQEQIKAAMKAREKERLVTLRGLSAAIKQIEIDTRTDVDDSKVSDIIQKEVKKRRDALEFAEKQNRSELVQQNKSEIAVLQEFLDPQLSEEELRK